MKTDKTEKIERIIEKSMLVVLSACGVLYPYTFSGCHYRIDKNVAVIKNLPII